MFFVYVISSKIKKYIYVGLTGNVKNRVNQHNSGKEKTTKPYIPYELIHEEKREKQLKTGIGKEWIKKNLII
jgi:putative endonuclease